MKVVTVKHYILFSLREIIPFNFWKINFNYGRTLIFFQDSFKGKICVNGTSPFSVLFLLPYLCSFYGHLLFVLVIYWCVTAVLLGVCTAAIEVIVQHMPQLQKFMLLYYAVIKYFITLPWNVVHININFARSNTKRR